MEVKRCFWFVLSGRSIPVDAVCPFKGRERSVEMFYWFFLAC